jgi:3-phenylpropionate/trans-cinnamate dioxygenase ferredoxin reductase subunit
MHAQHVKYVIVGGGLAGSSAVEAIRRRDRAGSLLLIGQEVNRPYHRPPLSKSYLRRETDRADLTALPLGWYAERHVELRTGRRVTSIDTARATIGLDSGEEFSYDTMLLAVGSSAAPLNLPGANLPNVYLLRTIEDADRLHHAIDKALAEGRPHPPAVLPSGQIAQSPHKVAGVKATTGTGRGRAVVVGAGLLGIEVAGSLRQAGLHVELLSANELPWDGTAGEAAGKFLCRLMEDHGIVVRRACPAARFEGDGRVQSVLVNSREQGPQRVDCDLVVGAVGIVPHRELVRGTPIAAERAILTDDRCRSSVSGIFAAGDCAAIRDPLFGKHRLIDHSDHARISGAIAGANMAHLCGHGKNDSDEDLRYHLVSHFDSEVLGVRINVWGEPRLVERRLLRGTTSQTDAQFAEIGLAADGRVAQVLAVGRAAEHKLLEKLVFLRLDASSIESKLKDPDVNLADIVGAD